MALQRTLRGALCTLLAATAMVAAPPTSSAAVEPEHRLKASQRPNAALAETVNKALRGTEQAAVPLVAGTLRDNEGLPVAGTSLRMDLEPTRAVISAAEAGIGLEYIKIAEARTTQDGSFAFTAPRLQDLAGYADERGVASALITSTSGQHSVWRRVYLNTPSARSSRWTLAQPPQPRRTVTNQDRVIDGSGFAPAVVPETETALQLVGHPGPPSGAPQAIPNPAQYCNSNEGYYFAMTRIPVKRNFVTVRAHATGPNTKATYVWGTTETTQIEAAANIGANGALAKVGFTSVQSVSAGINFEIGHYQPAYFQAEFDFRTWDLWCENHITLAKRLSGKFEWRPFIFTGGNDIDPGGGNQGVCPNPDTITKISSATWVARESTWTRHGGVDFGAVKLDSRTTNGASWKLTVTPVRQASICGLEDYPIYASYVMEEY